MAKKNEKKVNGRPRKDNLYVGISAPREFVELIRKIGLNSPSKGVEFLWEEIKDDAKLLKKLRRE